MSINFGRFSNDREAVQELALSLAQKCMDCSCFSQEDVTNCFDDDCALWKNRLDMRLTRSQIQFLREKRNLTTKKPIES